ncbi:MAG TPA: MBOAT family O-acyltransferase, partial [Cellvibrionaceae bacterium]|nr:MBOAT family O-acyltransferase [Cellvibrionaceae bacterium]
AGLVVRPDGSRRRWPVSLGIVLALCNLGLFKYYNFFRESLVAALGTSIENSSLPLLDILLPVGISFYTFCGIAYLIEVGRGNQQPAPWLEGCLLLAFFPTLLAGPICRPKELLPQLSQEQARTIIEPERIGLLILSALIKKIWLASWLAEQFVKPVFADPSAFHALDLTAAIIAYAWQIFFDFSGYTDIVTACALLLGIKVPVNFLQPYLATSLSDFWQRWHISLSSWIRDYVYIPLGGSRGNWWRTQLNALLAMVISGIWHGANLTFVIWGLWHGAGWTAQNLWRRLNKNTLPRGLAQTLTFVFVCIGWVFFRADDVPRAVEFLQGFGQWRIPTQLNYLGLFAACAIYFYCSRTSQVFVDYLQCKLANVHWSLQAAAITTCALFIIQLAPSGMPGFIYFGF